MFVVKRDGRREPVYFDKINTRIQHLSYGLDLDYVDPAQITQKTCSGVYKGVTTTELDELAAETAANQSSMHPDYAILAARIAISNLHKNTKKRFSDVMEDQYNYIDPHTSLRAPQLSDNVYSFIQQNTEKQNSAIIYNRDYKYDYFGFKTLERAYLLRLYGQVAERPQHMLMRVACGIHCGDVNAAIETYKQMSDKWFIHASPTLFNAGTPHPQLSSCFLVDMKEDSIDGIYSTLKTCAVISKHAGGVGLAVHNIRATGSYIRGTNGVSNGLIPMLRVFNNTARYVDQGGGKRKGAFAVYLEPWHADVFEFLDLRKNHGLEEHRTRDLFLALWIPDLFMERVEKNLAWSLMCPDECPGQPDVWGEEFNTLYCRYENEGRAKKVIKARTLWASILEAQQETGVPYILYKDACNAKSNQKNLGTIKSSNLCTEIVEYTAPNEIAVCNLASIALPRFVKEDGTFDYEQLYTITGVITRNQNRIIDINYYPVRETQYSNLRNRPIGIGVQGQADTFILMRHPYECAEAQKINVKIFETIYYAAQSASCEQAKEYGAYDTYKGSPISQGIQQFDMWNIKQSSRYDWDAQRGNIAKYGVRNSQQIAPMPTASTSQILGNNESFEPYTSNQYVRRTLAGEFMCVNGHLQRDQVKLGIWNEVLRNKQIANNGSIENLDEIPQSIRNQYKTVWEMKGKIQIDMAAARGAYIDQSQSFNVHMVDVNFAKLTSMHFYAWKKGLKTGMYYLRTKPAADAIKFTQNVSAQKAADADTKFIESNDSQPSIYSTPTRKQVYRDTVESGGTPTAALASAAVSASAAPTSVMSATVPKSPTQIASPSPQVLGGGLGLESIKLSNIRVGRNTERPLQPTSMCGEDNESVQKQDESTRQLGASTPPQILKSITKTPTRGMMITPSTKQERRQEEEDCITAWRAERERKKAEVMCALDNTDTCLSCGS